MATMVIETKELPVTSKPVSRKERTLIQIDYLVRAIPDAPIETASFNKVRTFLVTCTTITLGASRIFERIDLGNELDASLNSLVIYINSINDSFLLNGKLPRPDTAQQVRGQLYQFFCTFHEAIQQFK